MLKININQSTIIDAPIDRVWAVLRDFNSHDQWHPAVAGSRMENDAAGDVVGGVRRFSLGDGSELSRTAAQPQRPRVHLDLLHPGFAPAFI